MAVAPPLIAVAIARTTDDERWTAVVTDAESRDDVWWATDLDPAELVRHLGTVERDRTPRWVWWGHDTARALAHLDVRPMRCWDLAAVHRLLHGDWRANAARVWARANDLDSSSIPELRPPDLFSAADDHDPEQPVRADGHLDPAWAEGGWSESPARLRRWNLLALDVLDRQRSLADALASERPAISSTLQAESTAAMLAAELEVEGLPFDREVGERILTDLVGPRPRSAAEEVESVAQRDESVLRHVPDGPSYDLRSPEQVKSMLRRCGVEVPDTRSWRLERLVDAHPVVQPLLDWRKAERMATTFGYGWIDEHVEPVGSNLGADLAASRGRLRGRWSSSDGAAGRMTATAGLHNMPAEIRPAVEAEPGHRFVRADLGQIEPRILAAVARDADLARATQDDDMYAPVAARLRVDREIAKVAVLGAMYGQTTGVGAEALRGLEREYPTAMGFLADADRAAQGGNDLRTVGGRLVRMSSGTDGAAGALSSTGSLGAAVDDGADRSRAAARGRYGRNAMIQGAAAEFFKVWALLVRARTATAATDARIVLCLHDELLVHAPDDAVETVRAAIDDALVEAAARWSPAAGSGVRFVADTSIIRRWSDAK
ncbi:MAG: DNA polymerase [Actinomycetota bacterium]